MPKVLSSKTIESKKPSSGIFSFLLQFGVVAILFFGIGFALGQKKIDISRKYIVPQITVQDQSVPKNQNIDFSLFWQVLDSLPKTYYDKTAIDGQKILYGAISGMVKSLGDPYTAFLDPKQNSEIKGELSGSYEGVGMELGFNKDKRLTVMSPISGTPAEKAGILPKDLILKIDNKDTFDMTLPQAVDLIRGAAGTSVKLTLAHDGSTDTYQVEVARAKITIKSVDLSFKNDAKGHKVGIIKVKTFGETTDGEWDEAVNQIQLQGAKAVVVDMRNNPGGLFTSAIHLGSEFISGTIVKQQSADGNIKSFSADHQGELSKIPMVVLVNGGSASAAEIFTGAIQDNKRGKIIGELTFGKGTVQDAVDLPGGSGLHVTIAKWLTPNGTWVHTVGIKPDIEVKLTSDDVKAGNDPQMDRALQEL
ncbi:MAG TPA: S41 family peptidase, partial [Candidatus Saccharimonadales bacterium]|nr:S41 family peptidase [Candidatus Saccharimonadales bacterium]